MPNHFITPILMDGFPMVPRAWTQGDAMVWEISMWQLTNEKKSDFAIRGFVLK